MHKLNMYRVTGGGAVLNASENSHKESLPGAHRITNAVQVDEGKATIKKTHFE